MVQMALFYCANTKLVPCYLKEMQCFFEAKNNNKETWGQDLTLQIWSVFLKA